VHPATAVAGYIRRADCASPRLDSTATFTVAPSGFSHFLEQQIGQEPSSELCGACAQAATNRNLWNNGPCRLEAARGVFTTQILQFLSRGSP
jgi:hypothetical protein